MGEGIACQNNNSGSAGTLFVVLPYTGGGLIISMPFPPTSNISWVGTAPLCWSSGSGSGPCTAMGVGGM